MCREYGVGLLVLPPALASPRSPLHRSVSLCVCEPPFHYSCRVLGWPIAFAPALAWVAAIPVKGKEHPCDLFEGEPGKEKLFYCPHVALCLSATRLPKGRQPQLGGTTTARKSFVQRSRQCRLQTSSCQRVLPQLPFAAFRMHNELHSRAATGSEPGVVPTMAESHRLEQRQRSLAMA